MRLVVANTGKVPKRINAICEFLATGLPDQAEPDRRAPWTAGTFWMALRSNITNPQVVLVSLTFLPRFIAADDPPRQAVLPRLPFVVFALVTASCWYWSPNALSA